ncbi:putative transposase, partial [Phenoliferia sp. Uapishka_3]
MRPTFYYPTKLQDQDQDQAAPGEFVPALCKLWSLLATFAKDTPEVEESKAPEQEKAFITAFPVLGALADNSVPQFKDSLEQAGLGEEQVRQLAKHRVMWANVVNVTHVTFVACPPAPRHTPPLVSPLLTMRPTKLQDQGQTAPGEFVPVLCKYLRLGEGPDGDQVAPKLWSFLATFAKDALEVEESKAPEQGTVFITAFLVLGALADNRVPQFKDSLEQAGLGEEQVRQLAKRVSLFTGSEHLKEIISSQKNNLSPLQYHSHSAYPLRPWQYKILHFKKDQLTFEVHSSPTLARPSNRLCFFFTLSPPTSPPTPGTPSPVIRPPPVAPQRSRTWQTDDNLPPSTPDNRGPPPSSLLSTVCSTSVPPVGLQSVLEEDSGLTEELLPTSNSQLSPVDDSDHFDSASDLDSVASIDGDSDSSSSSGYSTSSSPRMSDTFTHLSAVGILSHVNAKAWFHAAETQSKISKIEGIRSGTLTAPLPPAAPLYHPVRAVAPLAADASLADTLTHDALLSSYIESTAKNALIRQTFQKESRRWARENESYFTKEALFADMLTKWVGPALEGRLEDKKPKAAYDELVALYSKHDPMDVAWKLHEFVRNEYKGGDLPTWISSIQTDFNAVNRVRKGSGRASLEDDILKYVLLVNVGSDRSKDIIKDVLETTTSAEVVVLLSNDWGRELKASKHKERPTPSAASALFVAPVKPTTSSSSLPLRPRVPDAPAGTPVCTLVAGHANWAGGMLSDGKFGFLPGHCFCCYEIGHTSSACSLAGKNDEKEAHRDAVLASYHMKRPVGLAFGRIFSGRPSIHNNFPPIAPRPELWTRPAVAPVAPFAGVAHQPGPAHRTLDVVAAPADFPVAPEHQGYPVTTGSRPWVRSFPHSRSPPASYAYAVSRLAEFLYDTGANGNFVDGKDYLFNYSAIFPHQQVGSGFGSGGRAIGKGTLRAVFTLDDGTKTNVSFDDTLHVPGLGVNLISGTKLMKNGLIVTNDDRRLTLSSRLGNAFGYVDFTSSPNAVIQAEWVRVDSHPPSPPLPSTSIALTAKLAAADQKLWHERLGHCSGDCLLACAEAVDGLEFRNKIPMGRCDICSRGKMTLKPSPGSSTRISENYLDMVAIDIWGPATSIALEKVRYAFGIIDEATRFAWCIGLRDRRNVLGYFQDWRKAVELKDLRVHPTTPSVLKGLRSDHGSEFTAGVWADWTAEEGLAHEFAIVGSHGQNGIIERLFRTILNTVRTWLIDSGLPLFLWWELFCTGIYIHNIRPTRALDNTKHAGKTPYEAATGVRPNVANLRRVGCKAIVHVPQDDHPSKLNERGFEAAFVGYMEHNAGWRFYVPSLKRVVEAEHVDFFEDEFLCKRSEEEDDELNSWAFHRLSPAPDGATPPVFDSAPSSSPSLGRIPADIPLPTSESLIPAPAGIANTRPRREHVAPVRDDAVVRHSRDGVTINGSLLLTANVSIIEGIDADGRGSAFYSARPTVSPSPASFSPPSSSPQNTAYWHLTPTEALDLVRRGAIEKAEEAYHAALLLPESDDTNAVLDTTHAALLAALVISSPPPPPSSP